MTMPEPETTAATPKMRAADSATLRRREPSEADLEKVRDILFGEQSQQLEVAVHELREKTTEQVSALRAELQRLQEELNLRYETLSATVQSAIEELRSTKLDRQQMSELLSGLVRQLNGEHAAKKLGS